MTDSPLRLLHLELEQKADAGQLPLAEKAADIVPGEGPQVAQIMFIGEAPGFNEAVQRRPFVGKSGQLLRKTLTEVGLTEQSVYISNIIKVRPPDNRDPLPNEILAFKPYLDQEIELIQPQLIVTLGRFSMGKFLKEVKISQVHGRLHKVIWKQKPLFIFPMFHPAAALRNPRMKESFLADFLRLPKTLAWLKEQKQTEQYADTVLNALS